eukprot:jgi/Chrpa1/6350/Chrysochromulina_OHIO_Genome00002429-RA
MSEEGGVRRWQGRIGTWVWDSGDDLNAGDDATLFRVGPLSSDLMEKVESGEVSLAMRFGVFRYASLRDAYARYQIPFIQRRAAGILIFYALWRTAWTIHFALSGGSKRNMFFFFHGADWRNGMGVLYLYLSFALVASLPMIARQQERATSCTARTITRLAASPRTPDVVMALVVAGYLLLIPRVWNDNDPFDLLHADYTALDTQTLFSVVAVFLAIAAGGVFFSPLFAFASSVTFLMTWIHAYHSLVDHPFYLDRQNASTSQASTEGNQGKDQSDVELGGLRIDYWQTWPLLVTVAVIHFHREVSAARQFRLACVMQRLASRRIEQLRGEKQRLNYERAIEEHRAVRVGSDCGSSYGTEIELFQTWKRYGTETELLQMHRPVQLPQSPQSAQSAQSAQSEQSEQSPFLPLTPQSLARVEALTRTLRKCGLELDREGEEAPLPLPQAQEPPAFAAAQAEAMMADGFSRSSIGQPSMGLP